MAFLPGKSQSQRSLAGYSPWGHKELDTTEPTGILKNIHLQICLGGDQVSCSLPHGVCGNLSEFKTIHFGTLPCLGRGS